MRSETEFRAFIEREPCWNAAAERAYVRDGSCGDLLLQNPEELAAFFAWFEQQDIQAYLEIGTWTGRLSRMIDEMFRPKLMAACDLGIAQRRRLPSHLPSRVNLFQGDSGSPQFREWLKALGGVDLIFIDGDHFYDGARRDLEMALNHDCRFIVLHDIANDHRSCSDVKRLWGEVEGKKIEFVRPVPGGSLKLGIGVLDVGSAAEPTRIRDTLPSVDVFIQSLERPEWDTTRASIEASDIAENYRRVVHPPKLTLQEFVLRFLDVMYEESDAEFVLRLEDDIEVNRHILHNVRSWPALSDPRFGIGWVFDPGGEYSERSIIDRIYNQLGTDGWRWGIVPRSFGVVFRRSELPAIRKYMQGWFPGNRPDYYDLAYGLAASTLGKHVCVHSPSLVEHDPTLPSTLGHSTDNHDSSGGTFRLEWRRPYV